MSESENHKWLIPLVLSVVLLLILLLSSRGVASDDDDHSARTLHSTGDIVSLETVLAKLRSIKPGRVIETEFEEEHGRYIYELELVDAEGQVWEYKFDAKTGELLETEQED